MKISPVHRGQQLPKYQWGTPCDSRYMLTDSVHDELAMNCRIHHPHTQPSFTVVRMRVMCMTS